MSIDVSNIVMPKIYSEWKLDASDREMIDAMGIEGEEHICAIYIALRHAFAHNPKLAALWPTTGNRALNNLSPLEVVRREGLPGLKRVRCFLDLSD